MFFGSPFRAASRSHTFGRALKRIPKEFTPMRTMRRVDVGGTHRKIKIVLPFKKTPLFFSLWERAMHELLLNSTTVSAFVKLDPVSTRTPLSSTCPFSASWNIHPFSCREIFHALKDDHVKSSSVRRLHLHFVQDCSREKSLPASRKMHGRCFDFLEMHVWVIVYRSSNNKLKRTILDYLIQQLQKKFGNFFSIS